MSSAHTDRELRQALTARPGRHGHRAGRQPTGATPRYLLNQAAGQDPLGYKAVLRAITAAANLDAVIVVQHLLGLAMSVVIYLLLRRRGTGRWLAALAIAPVLLDAYQVQTEQTLMPDIWFEAMIVAGLAILLWRPGTSWRRVALAGVVLGTSATIAQVGEALLLPAVIYLLALGGGWRQAIGRAAVLCVAFAVPILAYSRPSIARPSGCQPPSAACARPGPSSSTDPTGLNTLRLLRFAPTTTPNTSRSLRLTARYRTSTTGS